MVERKGETATRMRAKLLTWMPGVRPEMMPSRNPNIIDIIRIVREMSMDFSSKHLLNKRVMFSNVILTV